MLLSTTTYLKQLNTSFTSSFAEIALHMIYSIIKYRNIKIIISEFKI